MPVQISSAIAAVTTETSTSDLPLARNRHTSARAQIETELVALALGRDRYMVNMIARSDVFAEATATRERVTQGFGNFQTFTFCNKLVSMPAVPAPTGSLWLNGLPFAQQTELKKGQSLSLRFELNGRKMGNLSACLKLFDLKGTILIDKMQTVDPGGLQVESETQKQGGFASAIGYIFIDRTETLFQEADREFEVEYEFELGNSRVNYPIERGFLKFVG
jgi:hypothetical protein